MTPAPHPKSRTFTWTRLEGPFRRLTREQAARFDDEGWFVLRDAFTAAEMDAVAAAIDPIERKVEEHLPAQSDEGRAQGLHPAIRARRRARLPQPGGPRRSAERRRVAVSVG